MIPSFSTELMEQSLPHTHKKPREITTINDQFVIPRFPPVVFPPPNLQSSTFSLHPQAVFSAYPASVFFKDPWRCCCCCCASCRWTHKTGSQNKTTFKRFFQYQQHLPYPLLHMNRRALVLSLLSPPHCIRSVPSISKAHTAGWGILTSHSPPRQAQALRQWSRSLTWCAVLIGRTSC